MTKDEILILVEFIEFIYKLNRQEEVNGLEVCHEILS